MELIVRRYDNRDDTSRLATAETGCIAVGVFDTRKLSEEAAALDGEGALTAALQSGDLSCKPGSTLLLRDVAGTAARRILLVGLGKEEKFGEQAFGTAARAALQELGKLGAHDAIIALPVGRLGRRDSAWAIRLLAQAAQAEEYRSDAMKSEKDPWTGVRQLALAVPGSDPAARPLAEGIAVGHGVELARRLGDLPPNVCNPAYLAECARALAGSYGFGLDVLGRDELQALGMNSYLAVAAGSSQPPAFVVLRHDGGAADEAPVVLVGKGLTFDSGGISIKPGAAMDEMKYDMCGAASVLGVFRAIGELKLPMNVIGIVAACENMPSGSATRPGDILTTMNGLTVEVLNTDAEGRLVLCDALTYAERFAPAAVIDIATLTGACVAALGSHHSGLFTRGDEPHEELAAQLLEAGQGAGDQAWRLPLEEAHGEQLKSRFADLANIGSPGAGAVVAAAFLERFTRNYTWAHLDIAGTAWKTGADKGATGRPVPLLTRFLCQRAQARTTRSAS